MPANGNPYAVSVRIELKFDAFADHLIQAVKDELLTRDEAICLMLEEALASISIEES